MEQNSTDLKKSIEMKIDRSPEFLKPYWRRFLEFSYLPPNPKYREKEIEEIAIKLIDNIRYRSTRNILIFGPVGSGKTMSFTIASRLADSILKERNERDYEIIYVKTTHPTKTAAEIAKICVKNSKVPSSGLSLEDYLKLIEKSSEERYIHVCLDEFDALLTNRKYFDRYLYFFTRTENLSATFITNRLNLVREISDQRVLSTFDRLNSIHFISYNKEQVKDILRGRIELAFTNDAISEGALDLLSKTIADDGGDIRKGLSILELCGDFILKHGRQVDEEAMKKLIQDYETSKEVERLKALPLSDKIILAAIYHVFKTERNENIRSDYVFAEQDYYRKLLELGGISQETFSVYLSRLVTYGIITVKKRGLGMGQGAVSYIRLRYSDETIKRMLEEDENLKRVSSYIFGGVSQ